MQVAKSAPDGATFLVTFDSHAVIPSILEKPGLDVEKDLVPVFLVGTAPYVARRECRAAVQDHLPT